MKVVFAPMSVHAMQGPVVEARIVKAGAPGLYERDLVWKWYHADLLRTPDDCKSAATT